MTNTQRKLIRLALITFGIMLLLLIIIFTPCYTELIATKGGEEALRTTQPKVYELNIIIMVLIPFLSSVICFLASDRFRIFTKEDALRQLENQFNNGLIDMEHYKIQYRHIEMFDLEKTKLKALVDVQKEKLKDNINIEAHKIVEEFMDESRLN